MKEQSSLLNGVVADGQFLGQGARKKSKFVPLYSQHGKEKLVIKLPGNAGLGDVLSLHVPCYCPDYDITVMVDWA